MQKKLDKSERVKELKKIRDSLKSVSDNVSTNWQRWVDNAKGLESKDEQGNTIFNYRLEAQFIDTFVSKFTRKIEIDLLPEGDEDKAKVETLKTLFAKVWEDGRMNYSDQANLRQSATLGESLVHIGTDFKDDLVKVQVPTGKLNEKGEEEFELKKYHNKKTEIYMEVVDMREVYYDNMRAWSDVQEIIWETWIQEGEWSSVYKNNSDFEDVEGIKPGMKSQDGQFTYSEKENDPRAVWYKVTKYYKKPTGNDDGDRFEILVNDDTLIYSGELPNRGFAGNQKRLPFVPLLHKRTGIGIREVVGIPEQIEQQSKSYNTALHRHRVGSEMSSTGFLVLEEGATLKNENSQILPGSIIEVEGRATWNKAPAPGSELLEVAENSYKTMVQIVGYDPRSAVVAQKVTTAFQRAAEEKAQSERLAQYEAEVQNYHQEVAELLLSAIVQHYAEIDFEKTQKNYEKGKLEPVYRSIIFEDVEPVKRKGKIIGLSRKAGAGMSSIQLTPSMLDFSGIVRVKTDQNRPLYELSDRQLQNEYFANTLVSVGNAAQLLSGHGFDPKAVLSASMKANNINLPVKQKTPEEKTQEAVAKIPIAPSGLKAQLKLDNAKRDIPVAERAEEIVQSRVQEQTGGQ